MSVFCKPCEKQINSKVDALILSSAFFVGGLRTDKDFRLKKNLSFLKQEILAIVETDINKKFRPMSKAEHQYVNSLKSALKKRISEVGDKKLTEATQDGFTFTMFKDQAAMKKNTKFGKSMIIASGIAGGVAFIPVIGPFLAAGIVALPLVAKIGTVGLQTGKIGVGVGREMFRNVLDKGLHVLGMRRISTAKHSTKSLQEILNQSEATLGLGRGIGEKRVLKQASHAYEKASKQDKQELKQIYQKASNKTHDLGIEL